VHGLILFCGEHGFCAAFNEKLLEAVQETPGSTELYVVGSRGALMLQERKVPVAWSTAMATSIGTITTVAHRVGEALYERFSSGGIADVMMVFARYGLLAFVRQVRRGMPAFPFHCMADETLLLLDQLFGQVDVVHALGRGVAAMAVLQRI
jgi:F0F1-type ATP synthase gamma subunit